jgi:hypothetical protein
MTSRPFGNWCNYLPRTPGFQWSEKWKVEYRVSSISMPNSRS